MKEAKIDYKSYDGKSAVVCRVSPGKSKSVTIPSEHGGLPVTGVERGAFDGCGKIKYVTVPPTVRYVGSGAFTGCRALEKVFISDVKAWCGINFFDETSNPLSLNDFSEGFHVSKDGKRGPVLLCLDGKPLERLEVPEGVEEVGPYAFNFCSTMKYVSIPKSLKSMGEGAFDGCENIVGVNLEDVASWCGVTHYGYRSNPLEYARDLYVKGKLTTDLKVSYGVKKINEYAFCGCGGIFSVTIPKTVKDIGVNAFSGCSRLVEVWDFSPKSRLAGKEDLTGLYSNAIAVHRSADERSAIYTYGDGEAWCVKGKVMHLVGYRGENPDVTLPDMAGYGNRLHAAAFYRSETVRSVTVSGYYGKVADNAFRGCSHLESFVAKKGVERVGERVFCDCKALRKAVFPPYLEEISRGAFSGCESLSRFDFPEGLLKIGESAFSGCTSLKKASLPWGTEDVGDGAFGGCGSLSEVFVPDSVKKLGRAVFSFCKNLKRARLPRNLETLPDDTFRCCASLECVAVPAFVKKIERDAFCGCTALKRIYFEGNEENFRKIEISEGNEDFLKAKVLYFSEKSPGAKRKDTWRYKKGERPVRR